MNFRLISATIILIYILKLSNGFSFFHNRQHRNPNRKLKFFDTNFATPYIVPFDFYTYCPEQIRLGVEQYRVTTIAQNITNATTLLFYCGLARLNNETCRQARVTCTSPGPTFDLKAGRKIGVEWINEIGTVLNTSTSLNSTICNSSAATGDHCYLTSAINDTFLSSDPTNLVPGTYGETLLSINNVPMSTHIHGLEILPKYDGNPTSWFTKNGDIGSGAIAATSNKYQSYYHNWQNPGTLWYHDHAMHATDHNVKYGLVGLWLIRNATIQARLPNGPLQKCLILSQRNETYVSQQQNLFPNISHQDRMFNNINPDTAKVLVGASNEDGFLHLTRNTYRIRLLNAWYEMSFRDLYFNMTTPSNPAGGRLNFTIIGADSSLMAQPEYNVNSIAMASAQRYELLFDLRNAEVGSIITLNANDLNVFKQTQYDFKMIVDNRIIHGHNGNISIDNFTLPLLKFINLTSFTPSVRRMRPLIAEVDLLTNTVVFSINAHPIYETGQSQNPIIGSIQDWVLINTILFPAPIPHPIHIHLINYQLIARYNLKQFTGALDDPVTCTWYALKYFNVSINDSLACTHSYPHPSNMTQYENLFLQNDPNSVPDVFQGCDANGQNCLYLTDLISLPIPNWQKNWKQTSLVSGGTVSVIRIRWAKTQYVAESDGDNYFHYPNEELTAFPGFVYHCHFLPHEDAEMMRPFLMQMPKSSK